MSKVDRFYNCWYSNPWDYL